MKRYIVRAILEPRLVDSSFIDVCGIFSLVLVLVYLRQRRSYMFLPVFVCLSVCLSVSKITQKRMHGFG